MIGIIAFNVLMVLLGVGVASQVVPTKVVSDALYVLHNTVGVTTPPPDKVRMVALIWIGSVIVIVDGLLLLFVFLTFQLR